MLTRQIEQVAPMFVSMW